jgi:hypothetical protein
LDVSKQQAALEAKLAAKLERLDTSDLHGLERVRAVHLSLSGWLRWELAMYVFPQTWIDSLDVMLAQYLKSWLRLPKVVCSHFLFLSRSHHGFDFPSIATMYRQSQAAVWYRLQHSLDPGVVSFYELERKRVTPLKRLHGIHDVVRHELSLPVDGVPTISRLAKWIQEADDLLRWRWLQSLIVEGRAINVLLPTARDKSWLDHVYQLNTSLVSFGVKAFLDTLPTKANLFRWVQKGDDRCPHCGWIENSIHVLSCCKPQLKKYTYRHDSVLKALADFFAGKLATEVELLVDLAQHACCFPSKAFPPWIGSTSLRPDIVLVNRATNMLWIVELTVGAEEFVDGANARKTSKYAELVSELSERWTVNFKALELGCRGLPTSALSTCVRWLADTGALASVSRHAVQALSGDVSRISLSASLWIWNTRSSAGVPIGDMPLLA